MATYRLYFRSAQGIVGRDDFEAEPDALAARVSATLLHDKVQDLVAEREEMLQRSRWALASSRRLLARLEARRGERRG